MILGDAIRVDGIGPDMNGANDAGANVTGAEIDANENDDVDNADDVGGRSADITLAKFGGRGRRHPGVSGIEAACVDEGRAGDNDIDDEETPQAVDGLIDSTISRRNSFKLPKICAFETEPSWDCGTLWR